MSEPTKQPRQISSASLRVPEHPTQEDKKLRTTHEASCHCGNVTYSVTLKAPFPQYPVNKCTCSMCFQNGYLLVYPRRQDVVFSQGWDAMGSYQFNTKSRTHRFCKNCGSSILIDFEDSLKGPSDPANDTLGINVRHFKDIDLEKMDYTSFDGRNLL